MTLVAHLVDDKDDLLAPLPDVLEEGQLTLTQGAVRRQHKQHQVRARHILLCVRRGGREEEGCEGRGECGGVRGGVRAGVRWWCDLGVVVRLCCGEWCR